MWSGYYNKDGPRGSDDSPFDFERVNLKQFPDFVNAPWMNTTMEPGDCLYTPAWNLHYVRTIERSVAAMIMFRTEERFDEEACETLDREAKNHTDMRIHLRNLESKSRTTPLRGGPAPSAPLTSRDSFLHL